MAPLAGIRIGLLTTFASRAGAGVAEALVAQADMIRRAGGEAVVFTLADEHIAEDAARYAPSEVVTVPFYGPALIGFSPRLTGTLVGADIDCLHIQGIWSWPTMSAKNWARATGRPLVLTPQGMLDPWILARGRWKKALARRFYLREAMARATVLHGLSRREAEDIRRECGRNDSLVLPNVGPVASPAPAAPRPRNILFIGRIHPKKNVLALVEAWKRAEPRDGWRLTIAGWGEEAHVAEFKAALAGAPPSLEFVGPVFGAAKRALLEAGRFTILPSHSEGMPLSILESWAAGTPAIMSQECNLPEGFAAGAAIDSGYDPAAIAAAIGEAVAQSDAEWLAMAGAAHRLAAGPFSAETLSRRWAEVYREAIARPRIAA